MKLRSDYKNIIGTTFLFGFVQAFNILVRVGINKSVAIFLGAEGMGIISLFNSSINLLKTGGGLGLSQSAVRDISEANGSNNIARFSRIISLTNRLILFSGLFGFILTIILSPWLSVWLFGDRLYTIPIALLSVAVAFLIINEGQLAILKGMRQLKSLAIASMFGSLTGLLTSVPIYYIYEKDGIIPSIIIAALSALLFSQYYVSKIKYTRAVIPLEKLVKEASPMIKMGFALMYVSFLVILTDLIISSYISNASGLKAVGFFQAGTTIVTGYFGIIITAMATDYYPRISAIHNDNEKLQEEVNKQSQVGLVLALPLIVIFLFISPLVINILYSNQFIESIKYTDIAVFGALILVCSNNMGMILLAKQRSNIYIYSTTIQRLFFIIISVLFYHYYGLKGLGFSYLIMAFLHLWVVTFLMKHFYKINFHKKILAQLFLALLFSFAALMCRTIDDLLIRYVLGFILLILCLLYSLLVFKKYIRTET